MLLKDRVYKRIQNLLYDLRIERQLREIQKFLDQVTDGTYYGEKVKKQNTEDT